MRFEFELKDFQFWLGDILFPITNMEKDMKKENKLRPPFTKGHYYGKRFAQIMAWILFPISIIIAIVESTTIRFNWR